MYEKLYDMNVLYNAFQKCKKGTDWKNSVQKYEANLFANLNTLRKELENETYRQKKFTEFDIRERGKQRHIKSLHISDRVVQRALCDEILFPAISKYLIYDNGASIKGKGIGFARSRLMTHLSEYYRTYGNKGYVLILDYSKYFDSIPHDKLIKLYEKYIDDEKVIKLVNHLVSACSSEGVGIGIGSQISQISGISYLIPVDNYCKIVKGCKYYGRYMDDLYIIHPDKKFLQELVKDITEISRELGLTINVKKTHIFRIDKGFEFLKLYHFVDENGKITRKICKKNIIRERRKLKKLKKKLEAGGVSLSDIKSAYKSWRGSLTKFDCHNAIKNMDKLFEELFVKGGSEACIQ